jgi:hypothetical protein
MIRRGKQEGWLSLPTSAIRPWAQLNDIAFDGINVGSIPGLPERGSGVIAARDLNGGNEGPLMVIPRDLVLSLERVEIQAKADGYLKDVLEATGHYGRVGDVFLHCHNSFTTASAAVLFFLTKVKLTHSCLFKDILSLSQLTYGRQREVQF